jgi:transcription initiation factor IIE alpha subunit
MGAVELKFNGTFEKDQVLKDFQCPQCRQFLTEQDISQKNYNL